VGRQPFGELVDIGRLPAGVSAHMKRIPHQKKRYLPVRGKLGQSGHILADIGPLEGGEALRGDAQRIAQRQSDAFFAQIEGENPAFPCIFLVLHASVQL